MRPTGTLQIAFALLLLSSGGRGECREPASLQTERTFQGSSSFYEIVAACSRPFSYRAGGPVGERADFYGLGSESGATQQEGETDDDVFLANAIDAASPGAVIRIAPRLYKIRSSIHVTKSVTIAGEKGSEIRLTIPKTTLFKISVSDVRILNLKLTGPQHSTNQDEERAIAAVGSSSSSPISHIVIENCEISSWGGYGVYLKYVNGFTIARNQISNINYAGVQGASVRSGLISNNTISNIVGKPNAYGIALTRYQNDSLSIEPRSSDVRVVGNLVKDVPYWEGLDTHGGERISFIKNSVMNTYAGVVVGVSKDSDGRAVFPPLDCVVDANELDSRKKDGTAGYGIVFHGGHVFAGLATQKATGAITNNIVTGYGDEGNTNHGAIHAYNTERLVISENRVIEPSPYGINLLEGNSNAVVAGNTIIDPWSDHNGQAVGIYLRGANNTALIAGNNIYSASKTAKSVLTTGIRVASGNNKVRLGSNTSSAKNFTMDDAGPNAAAIAYERDPSTAVPKQSRGHSKVEINWTPEVLGDGETDTTNVTSFEARIGDKVTVRPSRVLPSGVTLGGTVTASGIITLTLSNRSRRRTKLGSIRMLIEKWSY